MQQFRKYLPHVLGLGLLAIQVFIPSFSEGLPASIPCQGKNCYRPNLSTPWNYVLSATPNFGVKAELFDIDLFENTAAVVAKAHANNKKVVCYMSAGSSENWRPDFKNFPKALLGKNMDGWAGEKWLDVRNITALAPIMTARLDQCKAKGFDAVEFDNVDGYSNASGFPLTENDQLKYNIFLANEAHRRGLAVGLKNDLDQVSILSQYFDFAMNEQCFQYGECSALTAFTSKGKPVFNVEYSGNVLTLAKKAKALNFNTIKKKLNLDNTYEVAN